MFYGLLLAAIVTMTTAYRGYKMAIPNGDFVPDPCNPGSTWAGVGHLLSLGTGDRNAFGQAFQAEGHLWTSALCHADSDQDGVSNGAELGDPHCHWSADNSGRLMAAKSHPGICEPIGSTQCKWQQFSCQHKGRR